MPLPKRRFEQFFAYPENGVWMVVHYKDDHTGPEDYEVINSGIPVKYKQVIDTEQAEQDIDGMHGEGITKGRLQEVFESKEDFMSEYMDDES